MPAPRYVYNRTARNNRPWDNQRPEPGVCPFCFIRWGQRGTGQGCDPTDCRACGTTVCMGYGLGRGRCPVCYIGLLDGWASSQKRCQRAGCNAQAAGEWRKRALCVEHLEASGQLPQPEAVATRLRIDFIQLPVPGQTV